MREDIDRLFGDALATPGGAVGRGPKRCYVEIDPERIRGFVDLITHPWVEAVCEALPGPEYRIVEIGFDVPGPGAEYQPWHRDFPAPEETIRGLHLDSLAFNVTAVDTTPEMGPFEIAPGVINAERHDLQFTGDYYERLPDTVRRHLTCRVVEKLEPIHQAHTIEGLVMGAA